MANEMPKSDSYTGLSRVVLQYSEAFAQIVSKAKTGVLTQADWARLEQLVDVDAFVRQGVFLTAKAEILGWEKYKSYISLYAGGVSWEGTLRHITEEKSRVILELEERNTRNDTTDVSNTVTVYEFNEAGQLCRLEVYVMPLHEM